MSRSLKTIRAQMAIKAGLLHVLTFVEHPRFFVFAILLGVLLSIVGQYWLVALLFVVMIWHQRQTARRREQVIRHVFAGLDIQLNGQRWTGKAARIALIEWQGPRQDRSVPVLARVTAKHSGDRWFYVEIALIELTPVGQPTVQPLDEPAAKARLQHNRAVYEHFFCVPGLSA